MLLKGTKVTLRAMEPADVDLLMEWENNSENWEVSGTIAPFSRNSIEGLIQQAHLSIFQTGQLRLMINRNTDQKCVGTIDLFDFDAFHQRAGVGVLIARAEDRGLGYAAESLDLVRSYAFEHLGLHQLYCHILTDNEKSISLFMSAGFEISGVQKAWIRVKKEFKDQYFMQLINEKA